jgi:hypothetical protein
MPFETVRCEDEAQWTDAESLVKGRVGRMWG